MTADYDNSDLTPQARAEALLPLLSLQEKILQLTINQPNGNTRLGIPHMECGEALHGIQKPQATVFPQAIAMGATWDPELVERIGAVIAKEASTAGVHLVFSPMLGLGRDPRWGRIEESFGEDPHLVSRMGVAFIKGLQGPTGEFPARNRIMATAKHFVADGEPRGGINGAPVDISMETLRECHLRPFEAAVKEAKVAGIMPAHHSINRVPCHASEWLLGDLLRNEWGFDGYIVSDMADIVKLMGLRNRVGFEPTKCEQHRIAQDPMEAAYLALKAGVDIDLPGSWDTRSYNEKLIEAVGEKRWDDLEALIDRAVMRVLITKFKLGLFDNGRPILPEEDPRVSGAQTVIENAEDEYVRKMAKGEASSTIKARLEDEYREVVNDPAHDELALEAARKAIVLLKNQDNLLPLSAAGLKRIAVIGPNADEMVFGGYSNLQPRQHVTILQGIRNAVGDAVEVVFAKGCEITRDQTEAPVESIREAVEVAETGDVVILVVGGNRQTCGENTDIDTLELPVAQDALIRAIHNTGKPVVLVAIHGRPQCMLWAAEHVGAIIEGYYLGQAAGTAMAGVIFGNINPGGKLPVAVPRKTGQVPQLYNDLWWAGPKRYTGNNTPAGPLYPFGFGLSYSAFDIGGARLDKTSMAVDDTATLTLTVKNRGEREGDEVVQLYVTDEFASIVRPARELKAFKRINLAAGEANTVTFQIGFEELKFWKDNGWIVEPGDFRLWYGNDSTADDYLTLTVE